MNKQIVYLVKQYQEGEGIEGETIYIFTKQTDAEEATRRLNLEYASGVVLDEYGEFLEISGDPYHYYITESMAIESSIEDADVYNPANERDNEESDLYVIACYSTKDNNKFLGFVSKDRFTQDKNQATLYNSETLEDASAYIEEDWNVSTEEFHITQADDAI